MNSINLDHVAAVICEATCGLTSQCKSREAAQALLDKGFLKPIRSDDETRDLIARKIWEYQEADKNFGEFDATEVDAGDLAALVKRMCIDQAELIRAAL